MSERVEHHPNHFDQELHRLLEIPGLNLERIASLLQAESFLSKRQDRKGSTTIVFDAKGYLESIRQSKKKPQLPDNLLNFPGVILPPGNGEIQMGSGREHHENVVIHRTRAIMDLLADMRQSYTLIDGVNRKNMVRQLSYVAFILHDLRKIIFVNDEEGNATFLIHAYHDNKDWLNYANQTKDVLRRISEENPDQISVIEFRSDMQGFIKEIRELLEHTPEVSTTEVELLESAPIDWKSIPQISKELGRSKGAIKRWINKLSLASTEYGMYKGGNNQSIVYYSPLVIDQLRKVIAIEPVPSGWLTEGALAQLVGVTPRTIALLIGKIAVAPEDKGIFLDYRNKPQEYYSPNVIQKVREQIGVRILPPSGWSNVVAIADVLQASRTTITKIIENLSLQPEDQGEFINSNNRPIFYYSPSVVRRIQETLSKLPRRRNQT